VAGGPKRVGKGDERVVAEKQEGIGQARRPENGDGPSLGLLCSLLGKVSVEYIVCLERGVRSGRGEAVELEV
jgi:hypothetical protein